MLIVILSQFIYIIFSAEAGYGPRTFPVLFKKTKGGQQTNCSLMKICFPIMATAPLVLSILF